MLDEYWERFRIWLEGPVHPSEPSCCVLFEREDWPGHELRWLIVVPRQSERVSLIRRRIMVEHVGAVKKGSLGAHGHCAMHRIEGPLAELEYAEWPEPLGMVDHSDQVVGPSCEDVQAVVVGSSTGCIVVAGSVRGELNVRQTVGGSHAVASEAAAPMTSPPVHEKPVERDRSEHVLSVVGPA